MVNSKELKEAYKIWNKKLADSGFQDLEDSRGNIRDINGRRDITHSGYHNQFTMDAKQEYYRVVGHFLYEHRFKNATERRIWQLHGEAKSIREIVKILEQEKLWFVPEGTIHKRAVHETVQRLVRLMKAKLKKEHTSD